MMEKGSAHPALVDLLAQLEAAGYDFVTVTPATHRRVVARRKGEPARSLRDIFGWSLPFEPGTLTEAMQRCLEAAGMIELVDGGRLKSRVRVSRLGGRLFLHSAFPTDSEDSVFFGPDSYRFAALIDSELHATGRVERLVDYGAGAAVGAIVATGRVEAGEVILVDRNRAALDLAAANCAHAGVKVRLVEASSLDAVDGGIDLVVANPPFMMDEEARAYRDGGDMMGARLSFDWAMDSARRLAAGGRMILYTGVAMVDGRDPLRDALAASLPAEGCSLRYSELDPDIFGEELERPAYSDVERIAAVAAIIARRG